MKRNPRIYLLLAFLCRLSFLHSDLGMNRLNGSIPAAVWSLRALSLLYLDHNNFVGTLSPQIEQLANLTFFDIRLYLQETDSRS